MTREMRSKFQEVESLCTLCKENIENVEHVVLSCKMLGSRDNIMLEKALGFEGNCNEVYETRLRLGKCKKLNINL